MINRTCLLGGMLAALAVACGSSGGDKNGSNNNPSATGGIPSSGGSGNGAAQANSGGGSAAVGGSATGGTTTGTGGTGGFAKCTTFTNLPAGSDCGTTTTGATIKKVNALLVVDKSGSMSDVPAGFAQNKWISLTQALQTVITNTQRLMAYGLELFPAKAVGASGPCVTGCCQMPSTGFVDVGIPGGVQTIIDTLDSTLPGGGTPTGQALRSALNYFTVGGGAGLVGQKVVILATDGGPNCNDSLTAGCASTLCTQNIDGNPPDCNASFNCCDTNVVPTAGIGCLDSDAVVAAIQDLRAANILTIVLGIPGTEQYTDVMDRMADAGGMPDPHGGGHSYYAANAAAGVDGLTQKIADITVQLVHDCDLPLDSEPPDPDKVAVAADCVLLTRATGDASSGQWTLDTSTWTVKLLGDTCTQVQTSGVQRLDVLLGCVGPTL